MRINCDKGDGNEYIESREKEKQLSCIYFLFVLNSTYFCCLFFPFLRFVFKKKKKEKLHSAHVHILQTHLTFIYVLPLCSK